MRPGQPGANDAAPPPTRPPARPEPSPVPRAAPTAAPVNGTLKLRDDERKILDELAQRHPLRRTRAPV